MNEAGQVDSPPLNRKRNSGGIVVPHAPRWRQRLAGLLVVALVRAVSATLRFRFQDQSGFFDAPSGPAIYVVWHNRLALCLMGYFRFVRKRNPTPGIAAMVSASRDGGLLTGILKALHVQPVRGSSSRRGPQALLELTTWAKRGYDLALTPDGPRGPCYVVQPGVLSLAQVTGLPIIPACYNLRWKFRVRSWDRFQIPLPFSHCDLVVGKPVRVPREATEAQRERLRQELEETMRQLTQD
jgi:lysophospholipid acyltransferase (LPLAT)-like uncharacterized protein